MSRLTYVICVTLLACLALVVSGDGSFYQLACTDQNCAVNCLQQAFENNKCYPTYGNESAVSWCDEVNQVLHQHLFYASEDCSGAFMYNPMQLLTCFPTMGGPYSSVEYACAGSSSSRNIRKEATAVLTLDQPVTPLLMPMPLRRVVSVTSALSHYDKACAEAVRVSADPVHRQTLNVRAVDHKAVTDLRCGVRAQKTQHGVAVESRVARIHSEQAETGSVNDVTITFLPDAPSDAMVTCVYLLTSVSEMCVMQLQ